MICEKCKRPNQPGLQLMKIFGMFLCGDCYCEYQEKINQEMKDSILNG